jgi:hypothetical protein
MRRKESVDSADVVGEFCGKRGVAGFGAGVPVALLISPGRRRQRSGRRI